MLIYLDEKSAKVLRYLIHYVGLANNHHDILRNILKQLDEGLKNYEKE